jgi:hypothetical protein
MNPRTPLVFFSVCAVVDFGLGYIRGHSAGSGMLAMVFGLPLTALLFLILRAFWKSNNGSGAPRS